MVDKSLFRYFIFFVFGLLIGGLIILLTSPPKGKPFTLSPAPTLIPMKVYITGAINKPGVYELERDSRLSDLIDKAGGFSSLNVEELNLASKLYDGQQIEILESGEQTLKSINVYPSKVNINEADSQLLATLPGIGPSKAEDIIQYREEFGFFNEIEDILNVPGIGEVTFAQIRDYITINQVKK